MRKPSRFGGWAFVRCAAIILSVASAPLGVAQLQYKQPPPGSVYKEYTRTMEGLYDWRVTDPNIDLNRWPAAAPFVPNPDLSFYLDDPSTAIRVEATFTLWGGHLGTYGKTVSFNGNSPITIPPLSTVNGIPSGGDGDNYMYQSCGTVDVPVGHLHAGWNSFKGSNAGQNPKYSFGWGQHGWYGMVLRVYYDPASIAHPSGFISSPTSNSGISENPTISVDVSSSATTVTRVDVLASYDGFDTDGDGIYQEYHGDYHPTASTNVMEVRNHVGTDFSYPYSVQWGTTWIPDQVPGGVKFVARIQDDNGVWFVTPEVSNITLNRTASVKLYKALSVPEAYWVKEYVEYRSSAFTIPANHDLGHATSALFLIRSWNGINGAAEPPNDGWYINVGDWSAPSFGANHAYQFDALSLSLSALHTGSNAVNAFCNSVHHGIELLWPGPAVMVKYNTLIDPPLPIQLARFTAATLAGGGVRVQWTTLSETNNLGFEVQKASSGTGPFASVPNSFVPGNGTTLIPHDYSFTDPSGKVGEYYRLLQTDLDGTRHFSEAAQVSATTGVENAALPGETFLAQNHPNPFNPETRISFGVASATHVRLEVVSVLGERLAVLVDEERAAGRYSVSFTPSSFGISSGVYLYRLATDKTTIVRKMAFVK